MGLKTSVYLSHDLAMCWRASGLPLAELIRRGVASLAPQPDLEATLRRVLREERAGVSVADVRSPARYERDDYAHEPYEDSA
jgi:3-mercaptopyruvate sulfurtransferase SseA